MIRKRNETSRALESGIDLQSNLVWEIAVHDEDEDKIRLQLHDGRGLPCAGAEYTITGAEGALARGTTDGQGWLEVELRGVKEARVEYTLAGEDRTFEVNLRLPGAARGSDAFYLAQLHNLGFAAETDEMAIIRFQATRHLKLSGQLDPDPQEAIDEIADGGDGAVQQNLGKTDG